MFISYDLKQFGVALKNTRLKCNFTQKDINQLTGINIDTLRRIENGLVIPKYETLEILSSHYKTDVLRLLQSTRSDNDLITLYEQMDQVITSNKIEDLEKLQLSFQNLMNKHLVEKKLINMKELQQLEVFIKASELFHIDREPELIEAELILTKCLPQLDYSQPIPEHEFFSHLETRLLTLLAVTKMILCNYSECLTILYSVLTHLQDDLFVTPEIVKTCTKVYSNISYCQHLSKQYEASRESAIDGIRYANSHHSSYLVFNLLNRKAVAELKLNLPESTDSFRKCKHMIEILGQKDTLKLYRDSIYNKYKIDLYTL